MRANSIRDLPDDVYRALAERAKANGRSLAQQALFELRQVAEAQALARHRTVVERLRSRRFAKSLANLPDPVDLVREDRDA
jgi:plasmid stability protein